MINVDENRCLRCGGCVATCRKSALTLTDNGIFCNGDYCNNCGICMNFCPVAAISMKV
jgi:Pyruvate/2-oxoacid:ferredoxin oxidoreductase delta subunit